MRLTFKQILDITLQCDTIPLAAIRKHIPERNGVRSSTTFFILKAIANRPKLTTGAIMDYLGSRNRKTVTAIEHLLELQLIQLVKQPYWIPQLNAWRVNRAFIITKKGLNALKSVYKHVELNTKDIEIDYLHAS